LFLLLAYPSCAVSEEIFSIVAPPQVKQLPEIETLIQEAYNSIDVQAKIIYLPAKRSLREAAKDTWVDAELVRVKAAEEVLTNYIRIPTPIAEMAIGLYGVNSEPKASTYAELGKKRVATLNGLVGLERNLERSGAYVQTVASIEIAFNRLERGLIDYVLLPNILARDFLQTSEFHSFKMSPVFGREKLFHFVHKRHASIIPRIDNALKHVFNR